MPFRPNFKMLFLYFCFSISLNLQANLISFAELQNFANEQIQIRGFLYETDDNRLILASKPNLKSCCVENNNLLHCHIQVLDLATAPSKTNALTLEGKLIKKDNSYVLTKTALVDKKISSSYLIILTIVFSFTIIGIIILFCGKKS